MSVPRVHIPAASEPAEQTDFSVAASSLVDLSHLQETVVWLVNQLHRHQDEISILQNRRDVDIPTIKAQLFKQRVWMVEKKYQHLVEKMSVYGFEVFAKNRQEARNERNKWRVANNKAYKTAATKVMRAWEEFWNEEKTYRHHVLFSLRSIRHNRLTAAMGIWQYDWMMAKRDRAIVAQRTLREERQRKIDSLAGFMHQWARKKRHRAMIQRMTARRDQATKSKIVAAWKFVIDFEVALTHKLTFFWSKVNRARKIDAFGGWWDAVLTSRSQRGLVVRTQRYQRYRRLAQAMEDWAATARLQHKLRLLEICERNAEDPLELAQAMEHVIEGVVLRQNVRTHELQVAHALRGRISDLRLHASVAALEGALGKKVDKPTAEMIQRRGLRNWESITTAQGSGKPAPAQDMPKVSPAAYTKKIRQELMAAAGQPAPMNAVVPVPEPPVTTENADGLPQSSHRMLLEQQFRSEVARQSAAGSVMEDRYMRLAAFDAAHGGQPVDPAGLSAASHLAAAEAGLPVDSPSALARAREQVESLQTTLSTETDAQARLTEAGDAAASPAAAPEPQDV